MTTTSTSPTSATSPSRPTPCLHDHSVKMVSTDTGQALAWEFTESDSDATKYLFPVNSNDGKSVMEHHPLYALPEGLLVLRYQKDSVKGLTYMSLLFLGKPEPHPHDPEGEEETGCELPRVDVIPLDSIIDKEDLSSKIGDVTLTSASVFGRRLVGCLQLLLEESFLCEVYTSTVFVYDLAQGSVGLTLQPSSLVWPSVCFLSENQFALAAVLDAEAGLSVTTIDAKSGHHVAWVSMDDLVDLSGDSYCQLTPSPDGASLVLSIMENILHKRELLTRTFALGAKIHQIAEKYPPRMLAPCHWECIFGGQPQFSKDASSSSSSSRTFTLAFTDRVRAGRKVQRTFQLPKDCTVEGTM